MLLWSETHGEAHYELRRAGNSLRLYRNGIFHSQYNGARPLNGGVWDMLWIPLCARPPATIRKVLMLGVGAGAALKKIADYFPQAMITGVDLDAIHLQIARQQLQLDSSVSLHCDDAVSWLGRAGTQRFDVIIDDLFFDAEDGPRRAVALDTSWRHLLRRHLAKQGMLVANCVQASEARALYSGGEASFQHALSLRDSGYDNRIVVASDAALQTAEIQRGFTELMRSYWKIRAAQLPPSLSIRRLRSG
ncbi:MAG: methyltransferase domain-containing protein [Gammaproteobacteria bacterium]|nr:methyltransferase domain-containing protein [Gammaproteobacteria bacterium]